MGDLKIIAKKTGARKTDIVEAHYIDLYEKYFSELRDKKLNLLEIGIDRGGSLKMWLDYFYNANIFGIDIEDKSHFGWPKNNRCETTIGNQGDKEFWANYTKEKNFDIIIDDGSHQPHHQEISLECLWPVLNAGGIYVIEDLHCSYWNNKRWPWGVNSPHNIVNRVIKSAVDALHYPFFKKKFLGPLYENMTLWERAGKSITNDDITEFEETLDSIHIYKSICFLFKKEK